MVMISGEKLGAALTQAMVLKGVGPTAVAEHFGVTPPSVKDWQKRGCIHKKHLGRLVAYFADVVPPGHWAADPDELAAFSPASSSGNIGVREQPQSYGGLPIFGVDATRFPMAPVIEWARMGADLYRANSEWPTSELRAVPTTRAVSDKLKYVPVADDSLAPKIVPGDLVAIDPELMPRRDDVALFKTPDGDFLIRRYRPLPGGAFEAFDASGGTMDSTRHGLKCVGACVGMFRDKI